METQTLKSEAKPQAAEDARITAVPTVQVKTPEPPGEAPPVTTAAASLSGWPTAGGGELILAD